jgi:hypothetical protein
MRTKCVDAPFLVKREILKKGRFNYIREPINGILLKKKLTNSEESITFILTTRRKMYIANNSRGYIKELYLKRHSAVSS